MAGTILGTTNKGNPFAFPFPDGSVRDRSDEIVEGFRQLELDALIGVGGDGSLSILRRLAQQGGIPLIGIPKTIDNDVVGTEVAIGHATALWVATDALDRLQPTAASHDRVMVLEVMGRDAGHIALSAGISGGADVIILPELPYRIEGIAAKIDALRAQGRNFALVVVAEAARMENGEPVVQGHSDSGMALYGGVGHYIGRRIAETTEAEVRVTVLGHVQRGGTPTPRDRLMASIFGVHAVDLLAEGKSDRMVAWSGRGVVDLPLADVVDKPHQVDPKGALVRTARGLGIYVGEEAA